MAANFGIEALMLWPWAGKTYVPRHEARQLFEVDLVRAMREHPDEVADANALYHVTITQVGNWTIDTTTPGGHVSVGLSGRPDCTFVTNQETLDQLMDGDISPQWAVISGRLRVSNLSVARRLAAILQASRG